MTLEWRDGARGSRYGYAGKIRLFSASWGVVRKPRKPIVLRCDLPGYQNKQWDCVDHADAEARAERFGATGSSLQALRIPQVTRAVPMPDALHTAPLKPRTRRRARFRLGPIRIDLFVTGRPWWLPLDRR